MKKMTKTKWVLLYFHYLFWDIVIHAFVYFFLHDYFFLFAVFCFPWWFAGSLYVAYKLEEE